MCRRAGQLCKQLMLQQLLLTCHLAAFFSTATAAGDSKASHYSLIIDSGSSGTRIYAYTWQAALLPGQLPLVAAVAPSQAASKIPRKVKTGMYERVETQPGLSQYVHDRHGLYKHALRPLLEWAKAVVPRKKWQCTPIFLLATAGVRKLGAEQRGMLLSAVRQVLSESGFRFEASWARVITGAEEGAFGWVAANYLSGGLSGSTVIQPAPTGSPMLGTDKQFEGTLDLGGSSLEVTRLQHTWAAVRSPDGQPYTMSAPAPTSGDATFSHGDHAHAGGSSVGMKETDLVVGGTTYQLMTTTHHRYGLSDTFDRSVTLLLQELRDRSMMLSLATGGHLTPATVPAREPVPRPSTVASEPGASSPDAGPPIQSADHTTSQKQHTVDVAGVASALPDWQRGRVQQESDGDGGWDVDSAVRQRQLMFSTMTPDSLLLDDVQPSSASSTIAVDQVQGALDTGSYHEQVSRTPFHVPDGHHDGIAAAQRRLLGQATAETAMQAAVARVSHKVQRVQQALAARYVQQWQHRSNNGVGNAPGYLAAQVVPKQHQQQALNGPALQETQQQRLPQAGVQSSKQQQVQLQQMAMQTPGMVDGISMEDDKDAWLQLQQQEEELLNSEAGTSTGSAGLVMSPESGGDSLLHGISNNIAHDQYLHGFHMWVHVLHARWTAAAKTLHACANHALQAAKHALQFYLPVLRPKPGPMSSRNLLSAAGSPAAPYGHELAEPTPSSHSGIRHAISIEHAAQPPGSQSSRLAGEPRIITDTMSTRSGSSSVLRGSQVSNHIASHDVAGTQQQTAQHGHTNASSTVVAQLQQLDHPCLPKGYDASYSRVHDYGVYPNLRMVRLVGMGNAVECQALAKTLVKHSLLLPACQPPTAPALTLAQQAADSTARQQQGMPHNVASAPSPVHQHAAGSHVTRRSSRRRVVLEEQHTVCDHAMASTQLRGRVMALTGFYVVWRFFLGAAVTQQPGAGNTVPGLVSSSASREALLQAVQELCEKPWSYHSSALGQHANVEKYCLWGRYALALLGPHGMNLSQAQVTIGSGDVGWPLGAALAEVSHKAPDLLLHGTPAAHHGTAWWTRMFIWQQQHDIEAAGGNSGAVGNHVGVLQQLTICVMLLACVLGMIAWCCPQLCRRVSRGLLRPWLGTVAVRHSASERRLQAPALLPISRPIRNRSHSNLLSRYLPAGG